LLFLFDNAKVGILFWIFKPFYDFNIKLTFSIYKCEWLIYKCELCNSFVRYSHNVLQLICKKKVCIHFCGHHSVCFFVCKHITVAVCICGNKGIVLCGVVYFHIVLFFLFDDAKVGILFDMTKENTFFNYHFNIWRCIC